MNAEAKEIIGSNFEPVKCTPEQIARFWSKVDKTNHPNGCWLWTAYKEKNGYGKCTIQGKPKWSHRAAFMIHNGFLTRGLEVMHICDNPPCVNPAHLVEGTHADNMGDCCSKGRNAFGEIHKMAKLTSDQIEQIKSMRNDGRLYREIAEKFGVTRHNISFIIRGKTWKSLQAGEAIPPRLYC